VARLEGTKSSASQRSRGLATQAYDPPIKYAAICFSGTGFVSRDHPQADRAAEIARIVIQVLKGDVRLRVTALAGKLGIEGRA
jgi:hypothetical protein